MVMQLPTGEVWTHKWWLTDVFWIQRWSCLGVFFFNHLQKTWSFCNWKCINVSCLCDTCNAVLENREYHVRQVLLICCG